MEINSFSLWLMLALNALVCIILPSVLALDWSNLFGHRS